jgi:hypothetical protein
MELQTVHDPYYSLIASLHGITGLVIFITGLLQFILKKQGKVHRMIGRVYLYSWIIILATGYYIGSIVIVAIVLMGFYLCVTGVRMAVLKGKPFTIIDKTIVLIAALIVLFMAIAAIILIVQKNYTYAILATFFSILYGWIVTRDIVAYLFNKREKVFKNNYGKMSWYINHLLRMQFSFVTAVGAFTAVQNVFGITELNFILPAFAGFIVVRISKNYFIKKLNIEVTRY